MLVDPDPETDQSNSSSGNSEQSSLYAGAVVFVIVGVGLGMYWLSAGRMGGYATPAATQRIPTLVRSGNHVTVPDGSPIRAKLTIVSIAANDFVFYADVDADFLIERAHYYLQGTNLMRGVVEPTGNPPDYTGSETTSVVADYVRNSAQGISTFRYYDELGSEIVNYANWTSVRFVKVTLAVNVNVETLPNQLTIDSSAAIRNLIGK